MQAAPLPSQVSAPSAVPAAAPPKEPSEEECEFGDLTAMTCFLCSRQFKTPNQMMRHNKESDLHKARFPQYSCSELFSRLV
jgi:RNA-binding protein 5/10